MKKVLKYLEIEYTEKDIDYIDSIIEELEKISSEIVDFFEIKDFGSKVKVYLFSDLNDFRRKYLEVSNNTKCEDWLCGFAPDDKEIYTLCLEEYRKTMSHSNEDVVSLIHLIMHEFTHSVYKRYCNIGSKYHWLGEGIACVLSHQYDGFDYVKKFDVSLEQVCKGGIDYNYYRTMFDYTLNKYGKEYILKLINDVVFLKEETPKLYKEINDELDML